ncbi:MAG: hypothetical protein JEZ10_03695 [Verrucomicrobia bacterium]|nr:hypothetical protein [Verrucomicrobiota bacterium]
MDLSASESALGVNQKKRLAEARQLGSAGSHLIFQSLENFMQAGSSGFQTREFSFSMQQSIVRMVSAGVRSPGHSFMDNQKLFQTGRCALPLLPATRWQTQVYLADSDKSGYSSVPDKRQGLRYEDVSMDDSADVAGGFRSTA